MAKTPHAKNDLKIIVRKMTIRLLKLAVCSQGNFTSNNDLENIVRRVLNINQFLLKSAPCS